LVAGSFVIDCAINAGAIFIAQQLEGRRALLPGARLRLIRATCLGFARGAYLREHGLIGTELELSSPSF